MKITEKIKIVMVVAISILFANNSDAQETAKTQDYDKGFRLGFGLNGGIPINNDVCDWALGGDVRLQYDLSKRTSLTLTTGFTNLFINHDAINQDGINEKVKDLGFIPVKLGFKAFFWEDQFYVLGEVGGGFAVTNGYNQSTTIWSPGIGYANKKFDLSLRYEAYPNYNTEQIALRIAYGFKL